MTNGSSSTQAVRAWLRAEVIVMFRVRDEHRLPPVGWAAIVLEVMLGVGALAGGVALMLGRQGEILQMPVSWLAGSPFSDYFVPGLILFTVLGVGPMVVAWLAWRANRWAPILTVGVGGALLIWLLVQIIVIGYKAEPPVQLIYLVLGSMITVTGLTWVATTGVPWRAARTPRTAV
jgi:hypothetical protein